MKLKLLILFVGFVTLLPACSLFGFNQPEQPSLPTTMQELTFSGVSPDAAPGYEQIEARTLDGEPISLDVTLVFYIDPSKVAQIQEQGGTNYPIVLLKPIVQAAIQKVTSQYSARQIFDDKRTEWNDSMGTEVIPRKKCEKELE